MKKGVLVYERAVNAMVRLRCAVSPEPSLLALKKSDVDAFARKKRRGSGSNIGLRMRVQRGTCHNFYRSDYYGMARYMKA